MSSSSDEDEDYKFFRDRSEWNDVKPIQQDDGVAPVVQIAYSEKFKDVFDYFRGILALNEKSERALELTQAAIALNPANYTVWQYRRVILKELKKNVGDEMKLLSKIMLDQPKNYQVWHHRRALVEWSRDPSSELEFTAQIIDLDQKNYHAWQHRQWIMKEFELWEGELEFINDLLSADVRNNSAWNQRHFVIQHTTGFTDDVIRKEIEYSVKNIDLVTKNESAWNYLRGILEGRGLTWDSNLCKRIHAWRNEGLKSPYLSSFLLDMYEEDLENKKCDASATLAKVKELCKELAEESDVVRRKYWDFVAERIIKEHEIS